MVALSSKCSVPLVERS